VQVKYGLPVYIYPLALVIYSLIVFYGCYYVGSNFFIKIICSANTSEKEIAISFDDGPATNHTPEILQLLKQANLKAAFFCIGNRIAGNENILQQIKEDGHIIGNHSYSHHFWFDMFSSKKMLNDLKLMDEELKRVTGLQPKLFRPPYGVTNPNLKKAIIQGNYTPVGWSARSMDTVIKDEKKLLDKIVKSLKPGAVFLFHDTSAATLNVLPAFIKEVKNRGYHIVPLDKLLHLTPYA
jgi:peptidoglycan/xylan/chitin deacetylase (PgdA/CDA1 family)